jgi:hypothetical protein
MVLEDSQKIALPGDGNYILDKEIIFFRIVL